MEVRKGYKQTEVGIIPVDWDVKSFKDVTDAITCGVAATPKYVDSTIGKPFLSALNVRDGKVVADEFKHISVGLYTQITKHNKPKKGDILYTRVGAGIGEAGVIEIDFDFAIYVSLTLIKPKRLLNSYFLMFLLNSNRYRYLAKRDLFTGAGVQNLNVQVVREFPIPIPPPPEQIAIATALSDAVALISSMEKLIAKKRNIKQGTMQELLTGKKRLPGFSGEWDVKKLGEIGSFSKGKGLPKEELNSSGCLPAIPYTTIYTDFNEIIGLSRIGQFTDSPCGTTVINSPHLLIAGSSNMLENIGKATAYIDNFDVAVGGDIILYRTTANVCFLSYLLSTQPHRKRIVFLSQGSTIRHVYASTFVSYEINLPPLPEQGAITQVLSDMDVEIEVLERKLSKYRMVKQGMMQELLTGKTRLI